MTRNSARSVKDTPLPPERAVGICHLAKEYVTAGDRLQTALAASTVPPPTSHPLYLLFCHAIELALKASIVAHGATERHLRLLGHDLVAALELAEQRSPEIADALKPNDRAVLGWVNSYYAGKEFEYLYTGFKSYPQVVVLADVAHRLFHTVDHEVRRIVMKQRKKRVDDEAGRATAVPPMHAKKGDATE